MGCADAVVYWVSGFIRARFTVKAGRGRSPRGAADVFAPAVPNVTIRPGQW
jgi:hypothetical protein